MTLFLRVLAVAIVLAGCAHAALGLGADALLGAVVSRETRANASLDSQNRFYGTAFVLHGVALWLYSGDMARYATLFRALLAVTFLGGLARIGSAMAFGWPAPVIVGLAASELLLPPALWWWSTRHG